MLTSQQTGVVRDKIAQILNVSSSSVRPTARLFADLGGTPEHLMPLRLAIEEALSVQIEPVVDQINARTAIDENGLLTQESIAQIVDYLGKWPELPQERVSFPDDGSCWLLGRLLA